MKELDYFELSKNFAHMIRTNVAERADLEDALRTTQETTEKYETIQTRLNELSKDYRVILEDYKACLEMGENNFIKLTKWLGKKIDEINPNEILKGGIMVFLVMLYVHYERTGEDPIIFRGTASKLLPTKSIL